MPGECRGILFRAAVRNGGGMRRRGAADRTVKFRPPAYCRQLRFPRRCSRCRSYCRRYCSRAMRAAVHCKYYTKPTVYFSIDLSKFTASGSTFFMNKRRSRERCTHPTSKYQPIDFAVLWDVLHNCKYTHSPANGIHCAVIRCFAGIQHESGTYVPRFAIHAAPGIKTSLFAP